MTTFADNRRIACVTADLKSQPMKVNFKTIVRTVKNIRNFAKLPHHTVADRANFALQIKSVIKNRGIA